MAAVGLEHVTKTFRSARGEVRAVDDLCVTVADGELVVLVGPSGCGKTTTLRLVAGLEKTEAGNIHIGDRVVNDVAPKDRDVAMVFQNYALYPHMTVYKNLAFGLRMRRVAKDEIKHRVGEVACMLGIEHLLECKPGGLSGGERQRVAVGRAIVRRPKVFLFDEPLSNLDARLRVGMRAEIKSLHRKLAATIIHVTHDQEEAMTLGDRLVVMSQGVVQQCGTPLEIYNRPTNRFVAGFVGTPPMNFLEGRIHQQGRRFVGGVGGLDLGSDAAGTLKAPDGSAVVLGVRPEHVHLAGNGAQFGDAAVSDGGDGGPTVIKASVQFVEPLGDSMNVHVVVQGGETIVARVPPAVAVAPGQDVDLEVDVSRVHLFAAGESGRRLSAT